MKVFIAALTAGLLVTAGAQAQLVSQLPAPDPTPAPVALADTLPRTVYSGPVAQGFRPFPYLYGGNLADNPNDRAFNGRYKTDPRLLIGVALTPSLAFETGYVNLLDRGFHPIDERDPEDTSAAIGVKGFNTHVAARYTQPLGERLSAYGKLGIAYSENRRGRFQGVDAGLYTGIGARYQMNEKLSVDGGFENHGHAAERWGNATNASSSVKARLNLGF